MDHLKKYQESKIQISNPAQAAVLLYERCVVNLKLIRARYNELRFSETDVPIVQTRKLVLELMKQLNRDENAPREVKELVGHMDACYAYLIEALDELERTRKTDEIEDMIKVIKDLLDGYRGIV